MTTIYGEQYRLRAGSPMPVRGSSPTNTGDFRLHSFMAARQTVQIQSCIEDIKKSKDFQGQGGSFVSASYSRIPITEERYKGKESSSERIVQEGAYN